jgi:dipeptidyl aminopeptidase/acylaminoacyl peptidase
MPESRRGFAPEDIERLLQVGEPRVSPDGSRVAYVVTSADAEADDNRSDIWLLPLTGGEPRQLTRGAGRDSAPRWSPDGQRLAFVRKPKGQDEKPQIWLIDADGGEPWRLTSTAGGAASPAWSPDGATIALTSRTSSTGADKAEQEKTPVEKHAPRVIRDLVFRSDGIGIHDERREHIWLIPAEGGEARQLTAGDWDDSEIAWAPNGREIAFTSYREQDRGEARIRDLWVVDLDRGGCRRLTSGLGPANAPAWSADGASIAYAGHQHRYEGFRTTQLYRIPASGGEPQSLTASLDRSVASMPGASGVISWAGDGSSVFFLALDRGAARVFRVSASGGEAQPLADFPALVASLAPLPDGSGVVVAASTPTNPGELFLLPLGAGSVRQLTDHNGPWRSEVLLEQPEEVTYAGAGGWEMHGFLLKPLGYRDGERVPLVLEIHGGPHGAHGLGFQPRFQSLSARGYAVLYLNPRGSVGYGEEFARACMCDWGGKDYEDLMLGVDWAIAQGIADPERLFIGGYSYGGYMTSWTVGHTDRFRAAVCGAPFADALSMFGTSDISSTGVDNNFGGLPWEIPDEYRAHSPTTHIHNCTTPLLLIHWEGDLRCPIGQSEMLFATLRRLGRECVFVRYPGGSHGAAGSGPPSQRVDFLRRTADWFDEHDAVRSGAPREREAVPAD